MNVNTSTQLVSNILHRWHIISAHEQQTWNTWAGVHYTYKYRALVLALVHIALLCYAMARSFVDEFIRKYRCASNRRRETGTATERHIPFNMVSLYNANINWAPLLHKKCIYVCTMTIQPTIEIHVCCVWLKRNIVGWYKRNMENTANHNDCTFWCSHFERIRLLLLFYCVKSTVECDRKKNIISWEDVDDRR